MKGCGRYALMAAIVAAALGIAAPVARADETCLSPYTAAAWCWTGKPGAYNVYEVAADGEVQQVVSNLGGIAPQDAHGTPPP